MALPRIQYIDAGPALRSASIQSATAPGRALAGVGQDIAQEGQRWQSIMGQVREAEEAGKRSTFLLDSSKAATEFQNSLLTRTDYDQWDDDFKTLADERRGEIDALNLSPDGKAKLMQQYDVWQSREYENLSRTAALKSVTEARAQVGIAWTDAAKNGDREAMARLEEEADSLGIPKSDRDKMRKAGEEIILDTEVQREIMDQPEQAKKRLADPAFRKSVTPSQLNSYENMLQAKERDNAIGTVEAYNQARLNRTLTSKDQIEKMFPQASATLRRRLEEDMQREITQEQRDAIRTPEVQNRLTGQAQSLIDNYDPMKDDGTYLFDINQNLKYMEDSPAKARLEKQLSDRKADRIDEWNDRAAPFRRSLKDGFDAGVFGFSSTKQPVQKVIEDGLLLDRAKLEKTGMSKEQVDDVLEAKPEERVTVFRKAMKERAGFTSMDLPEYEQKAFEVIESGNEGIIEWPDAAAKEKAEARYGEAVKEFEGWYKQHPDASDEDMQKTLQHIFNPDEQKDFDERVLGSPMVLPPK